MEQVRLVLAIVLSLLVFLVWNYFFVDRQPIDNSNNYANLQNKSSDIPHKELSEESVNDKPLGLESDIAPLALAEEKPSKIITIETSKYKAQVSEKGAGLVSFVLKDYLESTGPKSPQKELLSPNQSLKSLTLILENEKSIDLGEWYFKALTGDDTIQVIDRAREVSFATTTADGLRIVKKFIFQPDNYLIDLEIAVQNESGKPFNGRLGLALANEKGDSKQTYTFEGPSALVDGKHEQIKLKKDEQPDTLKGSVQWIAFEDRYFMSGIIIKDPAEGSVRIKIGESQIFNQFFGPQSEIGNGDTKKFQYAVFFGPKKLDLLKKLNYELNRVIDFGFFDFLAKPLLWFMNFIYSIIPNYGLSIILLTLLTKIILWPLGNKSYKSMSEMKRLQPLMEEIREKYKHDKNQMNQEIMGLYRTYKINPMGGCLPMILQIPVFFALYRMLYQAIELRHAPFIWWINDLSAPDRLFHFNFSIPIMEPPYGIPVLTIIMGATMLLQQKMSPPPGDPAQAKMMMIMPVVFTFIFINFSSGLVLYWLVNNILSIGQQYYIQKKYA